MLSKIAQTINQTLERLQSLAVFLLLIRYDTEQTTYLLHGINITWEVLHGKVRKDLK